MSDALWLFSVVWTLLYCWHLCISLWLRVSDVHCESIKRRHRVLNEQWCRRFYTCILTWGKHLEWLLWLVSWPDLLSWNNVIKIYDLAKQYMDLFSTVISFLWLTFHRVMWRHVWNAVVSLCCKSFTESSSQRIVKNLSICCKCRLVISHLYWLATCMTLEIIYYSVTLKL